MNRFSLLYLIVLTILLACNSPKNEDSRDKWKNEILNTEKEFAEMVLNEGIGKAFLHFAADDAVLMRNDKLIIGKTSIRGMHKNNMSKDQNVSLTWYPDFIDVSKSGDLGYTYGKYKFTVKDSLGNSKVNEGVFHTVWKRQEDGQWRYVWD